LEFFLNEKNLKTKKREIKIEMKKRKDITHPPWKK